jgi:S1-C subfamily serine protease
MNTKRNVFIGVILLAGFVGGLVVSGRMSLTQSSIGAPPATAQSKAASIAATTTGLPDLSPIAERALKVAANISSTTVTVPNDPFYRFFYGDMAQQSQSLGSGVVVSPDGYVLTNTHVIGNARADIRVTLADGRERQGRLIGIDDLSDLAVVKVDARNLETLPWGDSSKLRVAEWVLAIGNPFQLSGTVTLGIVSTVSRSGVGGVTEFIQTDAAINPGNSGGALVNGRGELVGINSMIYSETGGYQGIGFAIPANLARRIMGDLINNPGHEVTWGSIGNIDWRTIDKATADYYGLASPGVLASAMYRSSSAYRAGLRPGDVVVAVNGQPVANGDQLNRLINNSKIGDTVKLEVLRNSQRLTVSVPVVKR